MPSLNGLRALTCSTLFGLLAVTGLRISEALSLNAADVDLDAGVLTLRRGKLGKVGFWRGRVFLECPQNIERDHIAESLQKAGRVKSVTYYLPSDPVQDARNATGGGYHSDGRVVVITLQSSK